MKTIKLFTTILSALGLLAQAVPSPDTTLAASNRLVFAHFMVLPFV